MNMLSLFNWLVPSNTLLTSFYLKDGDSGRRHHTNEMTDKVLTHDPHRFRLKSI